MNIAVHLLPVLAAALWGVVVGALWYHPRVLGTVWMREAQMNPAVVAARASRVWMFSLAGFATSVGMAYVLAQFVVAWDVSTMTGAVVFAFWTWAGLVVPVTAGGYLWEGKSVWLSIINSMYWLICIVGMISIITFW